MPPTGELQRAITQKVGTHHTVAVTVADDCLLFGDKVHLLEAAVDDWRRV